MTPTEHYIEAERLLTMYMTATHEWARDWGAQTLAGAQAHATLATATQAAPYVPASPETDAAIRAALGATP